MPIAARPLQSFGAWVLPSVVIVGSGVLALRTPMPNPWMLGLLGAIVAAALASIVVDRRESVDGKRWVAIAVLGMFELVLLARLGGAGGLANVWPLRAPIAGSFAVIGVSLLGLALHRPWARALGVGLGIVCVAWGGWALVAGGSAASEVTWLWAAHVGGGALLVHHLLATGLDATERAPLSPGDKMWVGESPLAGQVRLAVVAAAAAVPTLVAYALVEPGRVPSLVPAAVAVAATLAVGTLLLVSGRVLGAIAVAVGGVGLTMLCAALFADATQPLDRELAITYTATWGPAAAVALALGIELVTTMRAAWRVS
jgi:hypothetical protein